MPQIVTFQIINFIISVNIDEDYVYFFYRHNYNSRKVYFNNIANIAEANISISDFYFLIKNLIL